MTITIKHYGVTYSIKTKQNDLHATETLEMFFNLMRAVGYQEESIQKAKEI
jgi:hypothetical protein